MPKGGAFSFFCKSKGSRHPDKVADVISDVILDACLERCFAARLL
jgi:S-adenosylmethionine synthetase